MSHNLALAIWGRRTKCMGNALLPLRGERGASMVEYALLVALISLIALAALVGFGNELGVEFSEINSEVDRVSPNP